jgi:hypothetical protein
MKDSQKALTTATTYPIQRHRQCLGLSPDAASGSEAASRDSPSQFNQEAQTMKKNYRKAFNELKALGAPVYEREDIETFGITSEEPGGYLWVNYWDGPRVWGSDTSPELDAILRKHGMHAECQNPGEWFVWEC